MDAKNQSTFILLCPNIIIAVFELTISFFTCFTITLSVISQF